MAENIRRALIGVRSELKKLERTYDKVHPDSYHAAQLTRAIRHLRAAITHLTQTVETLDYIND